MKGTFPWLLVDSCDVMNIDALHEFAWRCHNQLFGTYVNPMRLRSAQPEFGYVELLRHLLMNILRSTSANP